MKINVVLVILIIVLIPTSSQAQVLEDYLWKNRVLIVKTDQEDNQLYKTQLQELTRDKQGLIERKLVLFFKTDKALNIKDYSTSQQIEDTINVNDSDAILQVLNSEFEVILIGLDGSIKLRQNQFLPLEELFRIIDSMPMRQSEIRSKK